MAATALRRPVGHDDRLSLVEHLDELRARLIVCLAALIVVFGLCLWQNDRLLNIVNQPLERETQKQVDRGQGTLGGIAATQRSLLELAQVNRATALELAKPSSGLPADTRAMFAAQAEQLAAVVDGIPTNIEGNKPVTLGIGEPFTMTLAIAAMFAFVLAMPILLYQAYAFVIPAFTREERRTAVPLMMLVPVLFCAGVAFGYFLVLPAAVRFLQNFNADEFNVLLQARDYYKFVALTLLACGVVFQIPVGILALTRLGVLQVGTLRRNRRYAIVVIAVLAMLLPGTDPITMLILMGPLVLLFELSILLASVFAPRPALADGDGADDEEPDDDAV